MLHASTRSEADIADAILESAGREHSMGSIPASIAALAAQAAKEKETGRLATTVELPQIPKSIAKMAAEAKHEIQIERLIDKKRKAAAAAKAALAKKASKAKHHDAVPKKHNVAKSVVKVNAASSKARLMAKNAHHAKAH
mmetsp:Transcript_36045/g.94767  ORF Transcript_36045/g.94767 Transcript_36045/m.94767 type:complete len:140 (+) Transcript_36045:238-657(+)